MKSGILICVCVLIVGCSHPSRWVAASDLREMSNTHVIELTLNNGENVQFDETMGWYNKDRDIIEGQSLRHFGADTLRLQDIQSIHLPSEMNTVATIALMVLFGLSIGAVWYALHYIGQAGG